MTKYCIHVYVYQKHKHTYIYMIHACMHPDEEVLPEPLCSSSFVVHRRISPQLTNILPMIEQHLINVCWFSRKRNVRVSRCPIAKGRGVSLCKIELCEFPPVPRISLCSGMFFQGYRSQFYFRWMIAAFLGWKTWNFTASTTETCLWWSNHASTPFTSCNML